MAGPGIPSSQETDAFLREKLIPLMKNRTQLAAEEVFVPRLQTVGIFSHYHPSVLGVGELFVRGGVAVVEILPLDFLDRIRELRPKLRDLAVMRSKMRQVDRGADSGTNDGRNCDNLQHFDAPPSARLEFNKRAAVGISKRCITRYLLYVKHICLSKGKKWGAKSFAESTDCLAAQVRRTRLQRAIQSVLAIARQ
ncbi:MAG: hypothetical protein JWN49_596 [Parcubacteria group bacterium]|nr:hypothetical protein [Parcubacteria group bacterium]